MFRIKNIGEHPVLIRDLNLQISGGKEVDLDSFLPESTYSRSVDLKTLEEKNKIEILDKIENNVKKTNIIKNQNIKNKEKSNDLNDKILREVRSEIHEFKKMLQCAIINGVNSNQENKKQHNQETESRVTNLQVANLTKEDSENRVKKNFKDIGKSIEKQEEISSLSKLLQSLQDEGE